MITHARRSLLWVLFLCLSMAGGCATTKSSRLELYEVTARAYESALRWSEFGNAYVLTQKDDAATFDPAKLQHIRVLSYDKKGAPLINEEVNEISQMVEISYAHINKMSERRITDRQTWVYSEKHQGWVLRSGFPKFP